MLVGFRDKSSSVVGFLHSLTFIIDQFHVVIFANSVVVVVVVAAVAVAASDNDHVEI